MQELHYPSYQELWAAREKNVPTDSLKPEDLEEMIKQLEAPPKPILLIDSLGESLRKDMVHRMLKDDVTAVEHYHYLPLVMPEFPTIPCFDIGDFEHVTVPTVFYNRARRLHSLKTKSRLQRRLDWSSNVRRAKRTVELQKRALVRLLTPTKK